MRTRIEQEAGQGFDAGLSGPDDTTSAGSEAVARWVGALAVTLVEMAQGMRPVTTLDTVATPGARRRIHRVVGAAARPRPGGRTRVTPVRVVGIRCMQPTAGAYEAAVTVAVGHRAIAVAARVEHDGAAWRIVELLPPGTGMIPAGRREG